jgi:hypothetical protein
MFLVCFSFLFEFPSLAFLFQLHKPTWLPFCWLTFLFLQRDDIITMIIFGPSDPFGV